MRWSALSFMFALGACAAPTAPHGMLLAAGTPAPAPSSVLVAFPKSACTGSINAVFLQDDGSFVSAIAPGTAAYVPLPPDGKRLFVVPSLDIEGSPGTRFTRYRVALPKDPSEQGVLLDVPRPDARNCWRNSAPRPALVPLQQALAAAQPLAWLDPDPAEGTRWLTAHRPRIDQLVQRAEE